MLRVFLTLSSALMLIPTCLAEICSSTTDHCYKGKVALDSDLFDSSVDCGLNLSRVEERIKEDRRQGIGESFANDVKLYAGNKQKLMDANKSISENPAMKEMQMPLIKALSEIQTKYTHDFMEAGLQPEQIGKIPPIKNFLCHKIERKPKTVS